MFIGHFAVGLGAKKAVPQVSLGTLFLAAQLLDLLWPAFLLLGWEKVAIVPGITKATPLDFTSYPYSHSLLFVLFWGLIAGVVYRLINKDTRGAVAVGLCVISHWFLDLIMHRPDLPLFPGVSPKYGLGLWNSIMASVLLEAAVFIAGLYLYVTATRAKNKTGRYAFWGLTGFLVMIHAANLLGPPPGNVKAIAWAGHLQWLLVIWAWYADKNRMAADD